MLLTASLFTITLDGRFLSPTYFRGPYYYLKTCIQQPLFTPCHLACHFMEERTLSGAKFTPVWKKGSGMEGYYKSHSAEWYGLRYQSSLPKGL